MDYTNLVKTSVSYPSIIQTKRVDKIDPKTFIGKGSIIELEDISKSNDIDVRSSKHYRRDLDALS